MPSRPDDSTQPLPGVPPGEGGAARRPAAPDPAGAPAGPSAPAVRPPRWSGRKTAVAAALAVGLGVGTAAGATTTSAHGGDDARREGTSRLGSGGGGELPGGSRGSSTPDPNGTSQTT